MNLQNSLQFLLIRYYYFSKKYYLQTVNHKSNYKIFDFCIHQNKKKKSKLRLSTVRFQGQALWVLQKQSPHFRGTKKGNNFLLLPLQVVFFLQKPCSPKCPAFLKMLSFFIFFSGFFIPVFLVFSLFSN